MRIEHAIHATVHAPLDVVWGVLGSFGDIDRYPQLSAVELIGGEPVQVGSIREIRTQDGTTIRERLEALGPDHSLTYSFDGPTPIPVTSSRTTVTAMASEDSQGATSVSWEGEFDVVDADVGRIVEHVNQDIVWPALVAALASKLGVTYSLDITDQSHERKIA